MESEYSTRRRRPSRRVDECAHVWCQVFDDLAGRSLPDEVAAGGRNTEPAWRKRRAHAKWCGPALSGQSAPGAGSERSGAETADRVGRQEDSARKQQPLPDSNSHCLTKHMSFSREVLRYCRRISMPQLTTTASGADLSAVPLRPDWQKPLHCTDRPETPPKS